MLVPSKGFGKCFLVQLRMNGQTAVDPESNGRAVQESGAKSLGRCLVLWSNRRILLVMTTRVARGRQKGKCTLNAMLLPTVRRQPETATNARRFSIWSASKATPVLLRVFLRVQPKPVFQVSNLHFDFQTLDYSQ